MTLWWVQVTHYWLCFIAKSATGYSIEKWADNRQDDRQSDGVGWVSGLRWGVSGLVMRTGMTNVKSTKKLPMFFFYNCLVVTWLLLRIDINGGNNEIQTLHRCAIFHTWDALQMSHHQIHLVLATRLIVLRIRSLLVLYYITTLLTVIGLLISRSRLLFCYPIRDTKTHSYLSTFPRRPVWRNIIIFWSNSTGRAWHQVLNKDIWCQYLQRVSDILH